LTFRLNSRCLDILSVLVASEQPLAASDIARQLNISGRIVRSSLVPAEQWLQDRQISLRIDRGKGISLEGSEDARRNLAQIIRNYDQPLPCLSTSDRLFVVLLTLFFAEKPVQLKQLQHTLNLSRTTIIKIINTAENWLSDYRLKLIRRPNYGYEINGIEINYREAVTCLLQECAGDARLLALAQGTKTVVDISYRTKTGLEEALQKVWTKLDIAQINKLTTPIEHILEGSLSDQLFIKFFIYIAIMIYRYRNGNIIDTLPDLSKHPYQAKQFSNAQKIGLQAKKQFGFQIPETEISWIAMQIPEPNRLHPISNQPTAEINEINDSSVQKTIDRILAQASLSLHPSLSVDLDLIHNLSNYLETILGPHQRAQTSRNPLLPDVKSQYSYIYSVAGKCRNVLKEELERELSEAEVGDIAICLIAAMERLRLLDTLKKKILVVCSAGVVTAWLLVSRLRTEFPDAEVVDVISARELENRKNFDGIDFIVSTIPLKIKDIPSKQVNPLLSLDDCKDLKELFEKNENSTPENNSIIPSTIHLSDLVTSNTIELGVVAKNWQEVVDVSGATLLKAGSVEPIFIQAMKEIILEFGPYMVIWPGTVLLHAPPHGVRHLCMSLLNLRTPVSFGHPNHDPVQIAIVLGAVDNHSHITALQELNQLMQDKKARSAIQSTPHKSVVLHWVSRFSK